MAIPSAAHLTCSAELPSTLDAKKVLTDCCELTGTCRFQLVHSGYSVPATFIGVGSRGVELRIAPENVTERFLPQSICCVSFSYRTSFCAFLGCVSEVRALKSGERRLLTTFPKQLTTTNLRQSFRIPVLREFGLETLIKLTDERSIKVTARDIATTGVEIEFRTGSMPDLKVGHSVTVEFRLEEEVVQRTGEVRRITGNRVGLEFGTLHEDKHDRQAAMQMNTIVLLVQQFWLRSRLE